MPDSIADILGKQRFDEPPEIQIIKNYVREKFRSDASVAIHDRQIIITVKGAALAGTLRMHLHTLKELCQTKKRLVIRIS
jgi:hypothetical protein